MKNTWMRWSTHKVINPLGILLIRCLLWSCSRLFFNLTVLFETMQKNYKKRFKRPKRPPSELSLNKKIQTKVLSFNIFFWSHQILSICLYVLFCCTLNDKVYGFSNFSIKFAAYLFLQQITHPDCLIGTRWELLSFVGLLVLSSVLFLYLRHDQDNGFRGEKLRPIFLSNAEILFSSAGIEVMISLSFQWF